MMNETRDERRERMDRFWIIDWRVGEGRHDMTHGLGGWCGLNGWTDMVLGVDEGRGKADERAWASRVSCGAPCDCPCSRTKPVPA